MWAVAWANAWDAVAEGQAATLSLAGEAEVRASAVENAQHAQGAAEHRARARPPWPTGTPSWRCGTDLSAARQELAELRRELRDAERAQVSAEATAVTLRETLAGFLSVRFLADLRDRLGERRQAGQGCGHEQVPARPDDGGNLGRAAVYPTG